MSAKVPRTARIKYKTVEDVIGNTPLVRLVRLPGLDNEQRGNVILGKLEGNNPAGSVKDRPAISMIRRAEERGEIRPGDTLIEATSGIYRHRPGDGRGDPRLPHAADHARGPERRARADDARLSAPS